MAAEAIAPPKEAEEAEKVAIDCLGVHSRDNMMSRSHLYNMLYHNWLEIRALCALYCVR